MNIIAHRVSPMVYMLESGVQIYPDPETGLWQYANGVFVCEDVIVVEDQLTDAGKLVDHFVDADEMVADSIIHDEQVVFFRDPNDRRNY